MLDLARDTAATVKKANSENVPVSSEERGKAALTELFNSVKNANTPVIIERIITEIDDIVKVVRFPGWQNTNQGRNDVEKAIKSIFIKKGCLITSCLRRHIATWNSIIRNVVIIKTDTGGRILWMRVLFVNAKIIKK